MKKLYSLVALLLALAAQAQIIEKDLLGEWKLTTANLHGVMLDFETGTVTEEPGKEGSFTPDDLKKMERGIKGPHPFPVIIRFNPGSTIDIISKTTDTEKGEEAFAYTLEHKDGHTYVITSREQWELRLESGLMRFIFTDPEAAAEIIMNYKK